MSAEGRHCTGQEAGPETAGDPSPYKGWTLRWPDPFASVLSITCDELSALKAVVHTSHVEARPPERGAVRGGSSVAECRE